MFIKGTSLNATPENLHKTQGSLKVKTKKKPPPKIKGLSLNTIEPKISIRNASKKIGSFMIKHRSKISLTFLNTICTDSNVCIAFGKETKLIRKFFNNFDLNLISGKPKTIGTESVNGTVELLTFKRDGYVANAIFKRSKLKTSDNLAYEAIVGNFINKQKLRFPCFLETYGLYYNSDPYPIENSIYRYRKMKINNLSLIKSCETPLFVGIMIEYITKGYTLYRIIQELGFVYPEEYIFFMDTQLIYILYQIYAPLSLLSDVFTHYDLHPNNVMLYPIGNYKYIQYNYHYDDYTVTFNSSYIVKIIDYGRCFFEDETGYNPQDVYSDLCKSVYQTGHCRDCGKYSGFGWLTPTPISYISSQKRNMSHDLRLLCSLKNFPRTYNSELIDLISSVSYLSDDGTPEKMSENDDEICNVNDAKMDLEKLIEMDYFKQNNDYDPDKKLGEMHIYSDGRPMTYKSA